MNHRIKSVIALVLTIAICIMCMPATMAADALTVKKMTPTEGSKNVQIVGTVIQLKFSDELDQLRAETAGAVSINNGGRILAQKLVDSKSLNVYLSSLMPETEYTLKVTSAIRSKSGVSAEPVEKKFTTGSVPDYHQIPEAASDMSDPIWRLAYGDAGANEKSIKFIKDGDNDVLQFTAGWADAPLLHFVRVTPGATYKARARVKSNVAQALRVVMYYGTGSDDIAYRIGNTWDQNVQEGEWVEISSEFKIPEDVNTSISGTNVQVTARKNGSVVLIDDFQFYEINTDEAAPVMDPGAEVEDKLVTSVENDTEDVTKQKLESFGVYTKGEFAEDVAVTREMFSKYMASILDAKSVKSTDNFENYTDVDTDYSGHIGTMLAMNILTANEKGEVRPDDPITFSEVCRAFVVALGHQKMLDEKTPIVAASGLGIKNTTGLRAASEVTYKDLNGLFDSFINADCLYDEFGQYKTGEVLEKKLGITKLKGVVEATSQTSLDGADGTSNGYVVISGKKYALIDADVTDVLGKYVTYYVKEVDDEDTVLYIGDIDKYNKILKLDAYDVENYDNNIYTYTTEDQKSTKRVELEKDKVVIYNGKTTNMYQATDLKPNYGWVELIDNDRNGKYDVVKITDYDTYVVESYDPTDMIVRDKFENKFVKLSDIDEIIVYKNGKSGNVGALSNGQVVTVERSMDGKRAVLNISTNTINGEVGNVTTDDRGVKFISFYDEIHGSQLQTQVACVRNYTGISNADSGDGGVFYIDAFGNIAAFTKGTGSWVYGYIKRARVWDDEIVRLDMFTENNTHETLYCAQKVRIDSKRTTDYMDTYNTLAQAGASTTEVEPELIMYKTDSDGLIKQIKTARDTTVTDDFRKVKSISSGIYISGTGMIVSDSWGAAYVGSDALLLQVPSDSNTSDLAMYSFTKARNSLIYKGTDFTMYSLSSNRLTADLLLVKGKTVWNQDSRSQGIVTGVKQKLNDNDEIVTVVSTNVGTLTIGENSLVDVNNMTANNGTTGLKLKKGDYVAWRTRADGYVNDMQIIFKAETKTNMKGSSGVYSLYSVSCFFGNVTAKEGDIVEITNADGDTGVFNAGKTTVYRVNTEIGEVEKVTSSEISAAGGTQMAAFSDWENTVNCLVIYR